MILDDQLAEMLAKEIAREIDKQILNQVTGQLLTNMGWHCVMVRNWKDIDDGWCKQYLKGYYSCLGHYWYFEDLKDANFFALKWRNGV